MSRIVSLLFLVLLGCASDPGRPAGIAGPDIESALRDPINFGASTLANVTIGVSIQNNATVPLIVRRIAINSPGMSSYELEPVTRTMAETIAPGEMKTIPILTNAVMLTERPGEPLSIRTSVDFEAGGKRWREMVMQRDTNALQ